MDSRWEDIQTIIELLEPFVEEVNDLIESVNEAEERSIDYIEASDIYMPMVEKFVAEYSQSTMSEMLVKSNPYLAVELGLLTLREALREGAIPLTKQHVLDKVVSYRELPREVIEALNFTPDEYRKLRQ